MYTRKNPENGTCEIGIGNFVCDVCKQKFVQNKYYRYDMSNYNRINCFTTKDIVHLCFDCQQILIKNAGANNENN